MPQTPWNRASRAALAAACGAWLSLGSGLPATASVGGGLAQFERWLSTVPHGTFKRISDPGHPGVLYAGRVGGFETIVRVYVDGGRITVQKIEVELPSERRDEIALSIIARFFREFTGMDRNDEELWRHMQAMRTAIYRSGRKEASVDVKGSRISLRLDTQPNHDMINPERTTWGTLFWRGEARRLSPRKRR